MKVGNKVHVVDEEGTFIIKKIEGSQAILVDEHGFENKYQLNQLIPNISSDSFNLQIFPPLKEEDKLKPIKKNPEKTEEIREIDLHIGNLVDSLTSLQSHQMLKKQLITARQEIEKAKNDKVKKLILIHGKGKGVLKNEIYRLLETIKGIEYLEADIRKYRFGAVEIRFK